MNRNTHYVADTLSRRIAHCETSPNDLVLLRQLVARLQFRWLLLGFAMGVSVSIGVQTILSVSNLMG
ncbi:MAG: hypothetical protein ACREXY_05485 [Gammaproteobacteria bacterium]